MSETYIEIGKLRGPQGDRGPRGDAGPRGPEGVQGPRGERGYPGSFHSAGATSVPAGDPAQVVMTGDELYKHVEFYVPRGLPGTNGVANDEAFATYLGVPDSDTRAAADELVDSKTLPYYGLPLTLEQFGGGGGGVSDADALEAAVAVGGNRVISLQAGKTYTFNKAVVLDVSKVRGVVGNGASVVVAGDFPAFHLKGNLTGTANPSQASSSDRNLRYAPFVQDVRISSPSSSTASLVGTGILVEQVFGARISGCFLYDLRTGVRFTGQNRNVRIQGNEIWNMRNYGLHFDAVDLHQMNITGNIMGYAQRVIYFQDSDAYNVQIVSNDMQIASHPHGAKGVLHFIGGYAQDFSIVGNDFEDHQVSEEALIIFDKTDTGTFPKHEHIRICSNNISNYLNGGIRVKHPGALIVADNTARGDGYFVLINPDESGAHTVNIEGNQLVSHDVQVPKGGLVRVRGSYSELVYIEKLVIRGNQANLMSETPIILDGVAVLHGEISDNTLDVGPTRGRPVAPYDAVIRISGAQYLRLMHISRNRLRARAIRGYLIRITGTDSEEKTTLMCSDNIGQEAVNSSPYYFGTVGLERDNLHV